MHSIVFTVAVISTSLFADLDFSICDIVETTKTGNHFPHPDYRQYGARACGIACFISVLEKQNVNKDVDMINRQLGGNVDGIPEKIMEESFRNFGLKSGHYRPTTLDELNAHARSGVSFILTWNNGSGSHYSVFEGMHGGMIYYMDPNYGHRKMTVQELLDRWAGDVIWVHR